MRTELRESFLPPLESGPAVGGLADTVFDNAQAAPDAVALLRREGAEWREVTTAQFKNEVLALAKGLLVRGVRFGDRVGIMSRTRYEWTLFDYALWTIGAESVPVYPTSSAHQVRNILSETQAVGCVVENDEHVMTLGAVIDDLPLLTRIWEIDSGAVEELTAAGGRVPDAVVHRHRLAVTPESVATIAYTSGTTGTPKGCVLSHRGLTAQAENMTRHCLPLLTDNRGTINASTLLFLPLAHVYGRTVQIAALRWRIPLAHQPNMTAADIIPDLADVRPTFVLAVPHIFEKVYYTAQRKAESTGHGDLFEQAVDVAVNYAEAKERRAFGEGYGPSPALRIKHRLYDKVVYSRIRDVFGGRMHSAVSGGSGLDRRLGLFFDGAGVAIHEGYGLTESSSGVTCNPPGRVRFGTVGTPVGGVAVRIADDGEVLLRTDQNLLAYLNDVRNSHEVLHDGWLSTGDLGTLDEEGYLVITGRKKEIIVTSGGKSVSPLALEQRVRAHPLVAQCLAVGDNRPYIAALITLDPEALGHWLALRGKGSKDPREAVGDPELEAEIRRAVAGANAQVSRAESIRVFRILPSAFSPQDGLVTPSLKLKRQEVVRAYAEAIEELYAR